MLILKSLTPQYPANLRAANGHWYALSMRARAVYVSKDRAPFTAISYEVLADPKWNGGTVSALATILITLV